MAPATMIIGIRTWNGADCKRLAFTMILAAASAWACLPQTSYAFQSCPSSSAYNTSPPNAVLHEFWFDFFGLNTGEALPSWDALGIGGNGVVSLDAQKSAPSTGPLLPPVIPPPPIIWSPPLNWILPPAAASYTGQLPATGSCPYIADGSQEHGSMASDDCMPTGLTNQTLATSPADAYLFKHYLTQ